MPVVLSHRGMSLNILAFKWNGCIRYLRTRLTQLCNCPVLGTSAWMPYQRQWLMPVLLSHWTMSLNILTFNWNDAFDISGQGYFNSKIALHLYHIWTRLKSQDKLLTKCFNCLAIVLFWLSLRLGLQEYT